MRRIVVRLLTTVLAAGLAGATAPAASGEPARAPAAEGDDVVSWIRENAAPANALPSGAAPAGTDAVGELVADAVVVGLGASAEGAREFVGSAHGLTRYLVTREGFRTIALEDDWTAGVLLNAYVRTGEGDLRDLVAQLAPRMRTPRMMRLVRWVRHYNRAHREDVRFAGTDATSTRPLAYDAVADYVAAVAPDRLARLREYYALIRPDTGDIWAYNDFFYQEAENKRAYVRAARKTYRLVEELPVEHDDSAYRLALHNAYTIRAYYTFATLRPPGYRDELMAHNLTWWRERTGDRVVFLAASAHTAVGPELVLSYPPRPANTVETAGAYLHRRYEDRYVSVGFTFGHGSVTSGLATGHTRPYRVPAPPTGTVEHTLGRTHWRCYLLDLERPAPAAVRAWLAEPARVRVVSMGSYDPADAERYYMGGGSLRQWFDALVHIRRVSASKLL